MIVQDGSQHCISHPISEAHLTKFMSESTPSTSVLLRGIANNDRANSANSLKQLSPLTCEMQDSYPMRSDVIFGHIFSREGSTAAYTGFSENLYLP